MRPLNETELKVLKGLAAGLRCKEIAREVFLTEDSTITVCFRMRDRFDVKSNNALIAYALAKGYIENPFKETA